MIARHTRWALFALLWSNAVHSNPCELPGLPNFAEGIGGTGLAPVNEGLGGTGRPVSRGEGLGGTGQRADIEGIGGTGHRPDAGGIGGTGRQANSQGIGGAGIRSAGEILVHGMVTGFASICVNGIEIHYENHVPVVRDGQSVAAAELGIGQMVTASARRSAAGLQALEILAHSEVVGKVTSLDRRSARLSVLGQSVRLDPRSMRVAGLTLGSIVRVSGLRDINGEIRATRMEVVRERVDSSISGVPKVLGERLIRIGGLRIILPPGTQAAGLAGAEWHLSGQATEHALIARHITGRSAADGAAISISQAIVHSVGDGIVRFTGGPQLQVALPSAKSHDLPRPGDVMTYAADRVDDRWEAIDYAIQTPDDFGDQPDETVPEAADRSPRSDVADDVNGGSEPDDSGGKYAEGGVVERDDARLDWDAPEGTRGREPVGGTEDASGSDSAEVGVSEVEEPEVEEPEVEEPEVEEPEVEEPEVEEPEVEEPEVEEPEVEEPEVEEPEVEEPEVEEPEVEEPDEIEHPDIPEHDEDRD